MPTSTLNIEGKVRLKFDDPGEKSVYLDLLQGSEGVKRISTRSRQSNSLLLEYEPGSELHKTLNKLLDQQEPEPLSRNDVFSYISPLLKNPMTKVVWLMLIYGVKPGFLQFCISSMLVNKYLRAKFK